MIASRWAIVPERDTYVGESIRDQMHSLLGVGVFNADGKSTSLV